VGTYPRRHWRIANLAQPRRPASFAADQARRRIDRIWEVLQMEMADGAQPAQSLAEEFRR
jgi:hypothetical protein